MTLATAAEPTADPRWPDRLRSHVTGPVAVAAAISVIPVVRMVVWVLEGTKVQFSDYWVVFDTLVKDSGWVSVRHLVEPYNGHLMVVPKLLYWLNIQVFGGSNITLGLVVVLIALAQVLILWRILPRGERVHPLVTAALMVAVAAFTFTPHGAWSFLLSMSGAAWLTANLFVVSSVAVAHLTDRRVLALGLALLAAASYGTGIAACPVLLLVLVLRDRRLDVRRQWAPVAATAVVAAWYQLNDVDPQGGLWNRPTVLDAVENGFTITGSLLFPDDIGRAKWLGAAVVVVAAASAVVAVWRGGRRAVPWVGLAVYGFGSSVVIGYGRAAFATFLDSRYASLAVFTWLATLALLATLVGRRALLGVPIVALAVAVSLNGDTTLDTITARYRYQEELGNALRLGVADGARPYIGYGVPMPDVHDRLVTTGHHPFDGSWSGGCGLLGTTIEEADVVPPAEARAGHASLTRDGRALPSAAFFTGRVEDVDRVECVVVVDGEGQVVGAGVSGWPPTRFGDTMIDHNVRAVADPDHDELRLFVRYEGSDTFSEVQIAG